jgi:hypothetical protein
MYCHFWAISLMSLQKVVQLVKSRPIWSPWLRERFVTNLVRWHAGAVSFPLSDIILAQLACPLSDIMCCLHSGITNLSYYKHCLLGNGQICVNQEILVLNEMKQNKILLKLKVKHRGKFC